MIDIKEKFKSLGINSIVKGSNGETLVPSMRSVIDLYSIADQLSTKTSNDKFALEEISKFKSDLQTIFSGMSVETAKSVIDGQFRSEKFMTKVEKIKRMQFKDLAEMGNKKIRKRFMSDIDGELDLDRRYEINCFNSTRIETSFSVNRVQINVDMGFNCTVDHDEIEEYGAMSYALCEYFENQGIDCEINLVFKAIRLLHKTDGSQVTSNIVVRLKSFGEYIAISEIAAAFTSGFFRRFIFVLKASLAIFHELELDYGLGSSISAFSALAEPGKLNITLSEKNRLESGEKAVTDFIEKVLVNK